MTKKFYVTCDEKVTCWRRHTYQVNGAETQEEAEKCVIETLKSVNNELFEVADGDKIEEMDSEILFETEVGMTPSENNGKATIEVVDKKQTTIYDNIS